MVSGLELPVTVQLPGMEPMGLSKGKIRTIELPEGDYEAVIGGSVTNKVKFAVRSTFMDRFKKKPLYVLNVQGSALLYSEKVDSAGERSNFKVHYGHQFVSWVNVDLPFKTDGGPTKGATSAIRVDLFNDPVQQAFVTLARENIPDEALALAEWYLERNRGDSRMLGEYVAYAKALDKGERMKKLLLTGTQIRPVEIDWHRAYQDLMMSPKDHGALIAEYDALLKKEPNDSSLLYLRGRLCVSQRQALDFYNKSLATSFNNAYTHFAIASTQTGKGEWTEAMPSIKVARSLRPDVLQFQDLLFEARMAVGEHEALESELLPAVEQSPLDTTLTVFLCDALAASKKGDVAKKICDTFENSWSQQFNQPAPSSLRSRVLYSIGDFDTMIELYSKSETDDARMAYFEALLEKGRMLEALQVSPIEDPGAADPFHFLSFALGWKLYGDDAKAQACEKRAIDLMKTMRPDYQVLADLLADTQAPGLTEVTDLPALPKLKAITLAYLALKFPSEKAEYAAMARKLNVDRSYPYHLVARAIADGKKS